MLATAGGASTAGAAVPKRAQLVGGPTPSGAKLRAWMDGPSLCTSIRGGAAKAFDDAKDMCEPVARPLPLGHETIDESEDSTTLMYGVAGSDVAAVELAAGDHPVAHAATVAGTGELDGWRFFTVETKDAAATELHLLDADGRVRRAELISDGIFDLDFDFDHPPAPPGLRRVAHGRQDGTAWALQTYPQLRLAPTPLEVTRRITDTCVNLRIVGTYSLAPCASADDDAPLQALPALGCGGIGAALTLAAAPSVARVRATLGDGRRLDAELVPVPGSPGGIRAGAVLTPRGLAVRDVAAYDAAGRRMTRLAVGLAPVAARCFGAGGLLGTLDFRELGLPAGLAAPGGDADRLDAVDRGASLCLAPAGAPPSAATCRRPPVDAQDAWLTTRVLGPRRVVLGAVPAEIGRVRLRLDDETTVDVAPTALPESYPGRYRDVVRIVRADVPPGRRVVAYELDDAGGRWVTRSPGPERAIPRHATTLLRDRRGRPALSAAVQPRPRWFWSSDEPCLAAGAVPATRCEWHLLDLIIVEARCRPRRTVMYGVTRSARDRLTLRTRSGRVIRGRTVALPRRFGHDGAVLLEVPASAAPARLTLHRHMPRTAVLHLPPASEQCGYHKLVVLHRPFPGFGR